MVNEEKLLKGLKKKQRNSIEQAIETYTPYLSTVLFNMAGTRLSPEDTEEIISDVFVSLWKHADYISFEKGTVRSYISAVARNYALKKLSKASEYISLDGLELAEEKDELEEKSISEILWNAVMELGEPDNEIFVRYYKYGEKLRDIANITGLNLSTVKSKLSRGKIKLKNIIQNTEGLL